MIDVLGIGLDYLMLQGLKYRGDVVARQAEYARLLRSLHQVIYSPRSLDLKQMKSGENHWIYPTSSRSKPAFLLDATTLCNRIIASNHIDVITCEDPFVTGLVGVIMKRRHAIPLNIQVHIDFMDNEYWIRDEFENRFFNALGKFVLRRADSVRVGTTHERDKFLRIGVDPARVGVIPVHTSFEKFAGADGRTMRERYLGTGRKHLLFTAARITRQKDLPTMIRAVEGVLKERDDTILVIAGDGPERVAAERFIQERGLQDRVRMIGAVDHDEIPQLYAACDIYLLSSVFEGTCIALAEAAAAGKPVVATRIAGSHDLVRDGVSGFVCDLGDHAGMSRKIKALLADAGLRTRMGEAGRAIVRTMFSHEKNIVGLIGMWERTAARERGSGGA